MCKCIVMYQLIKKVYFYLKMLNKSGHLFLWQFHSSLFACDENTLFPLPKIVTS